jgi:hypothetical protein
MGSFSSQFPALRNLRRMKARSQRTCQTVLFGPTLFGCNCKLPIRACRDESSRLFYGPSTKTCISCRASEINDSITPRNLRSEGVLTWLQYPSQDLPGSDTKNTASVDGATLEILICPCFRINPCTLQRCQSCAQSGQVILCKLRYLCFNISNYLQGQDKKLTSSIKIIQEESENAVRRHRTEVSDMSSRFSLQFT